MIYAATITTPANTFPAAELMTRLNVALGLVVKLEVFFPPGSSGLLHARICDGSYQAFPATPGTDFFGDNLTLSFEELYDKSADPPSFDVWTYNLDDTYAHVLQVRMMVVSKEEYQARYVPSMQTEAVEAIVAKVSAQQEETKAAQLEAIRSRFAFFGS